MHFGLRVLGSSMLVALGLVSGCSLPREVTSTNDTGITSPDMGIGGHDAGPNPVDTGVDAYVPGVDAYVPPGVDAYVPPVDAYVPPGIDAYVPPVDAYVAPDAYLAPDAYVAPDAWVLPSCNTLFMAIDGYRECPSATATCLMGANTNTHTCTEICAAVGATCVGADDNQGGTFCTPNSGLTTGHCGDGHTYALCSCSHP